MKQVSNKYEPIKGWLLRALVKLGIALAIILLTLLGIVLVPIFLPYRFIIWFFLKFVKGKKGLEFQNGISRMYGLGKSLGKTTIVNMSVFTVIDGDIPLEELRTLFRVRVLNSGLFDKLKKNYFPCGGYSLWEDVEEFKLEEHVRDWDYEDLKLPSPCTEDDLRGVLNEFLGKPWKEGRGVWECLLVHNFRSKHRQEQEEGDEEGKRNQMVLVFRKDHALADGYSMYVLYQKLFDVRDPVEFPRPAQKSLLWRWVRRGILPLKIIYDGTNMVYDSWCPVEEWKGVKLALETNISLSPPVPVKYIKAIKNEYKVSYFVVALAGIAEALYRVHREAGKSPPPKLRIDFPQPRPYHPGGLTNFMYPGFIKMKIKEKYSGKDLRDLNREHEEVKRSLYRQGTVLGHYMMDLVPTLFWTWVVFLPDGFLVGVTPVPSETFTLGGFKVSDGWTAGRPMSPRLPLAAGGSAFGYDGKQRFFLGMDKNLFPDEQLFENVGTYVKEAILRMYSDCSV